jgi:hypothetical protein
MNARNAYVNFKEVVAHSSEPHQNTRLLVEAILALWFAVVLLLGAEGNFARPAGSPPLPILLGAVIPIIAFLIAYFSSSAFRAFVLDSDLRFGAAVQGWRVAGLGFLALYAYGVLPGRFAIPAGLGDIAIGVTAPWIVLTLIRRPSFARSGLFAGWQILGIRDLVVALGTGALSSWFPSGVTTAPMARLPLLLIPAYLVPLFVMFHLAALLQIHAASAKKNEP